MKDIKKFINLPALIKSFEEFKSSKPFNHCVCDNFFKVQFAKQLSNEFPNYNTKNFWHEYDNAIEVKKTCNDWNKFQLNTYKIFSLFNSNEFSSFLSKLSKIKILNPDYGLNGGGLHIHKNGGKLNHHLDYDLHPKLPKQRKLNLLIYLTPNWKKTYGGQLGFFSHNKHLNQPEKLIKKIYPKFNRAVIFDTTQNSWHGLVDKVNTKNGICRKSLAVYYLTNLSSIKKSDRSKALFAPTKKQKKNKKIIELIKKRSNKIYSKKVYKISK
tara:strand:+ start:6561 stop:7367 length:807 start_codon:yes stop_codon:yes gene_type:complete